MGNYGVLPNPIMKNVFMAHAFDLADPWGDCGAQPSSKCKPDCGTSDPDYDCRTPFYMGGGIHPRIKKPVGGRLAHAAMGIVYGGSDPVTGPLIASCTVLSGKLSVKIYDKAFPNRSAFSAMVNDSPQERWISLN